MKRVFLIVLDSFGIGGAPDAALYGDEGSNTLASVLTSEKLYIPHLAELGLFHAAGLHEKEHEKLTARGMAVEKENLTGAYARMVESSRGKDTTTGHWEIAGQILEKPFPTFPDGFPEELLRRLSERSGRGIVCNKPYSGTAVIEDYGEEHLATGKLIVYTSADSVLQIAAHESIVPLSELYRYCEIARELCTGAYGVGRVIARPFTGKPGSFVRTSGRHDYSLEPEGDTMLDRLKSAGQDVIAVGKISDIFAGKGVTEAERTKNNAEGTEATIRFTKKDFHGLCFTNLVDFDMLYGHRNDVEGYAKALTEFDERLPEILAGLGEDDILMIMADHGCDPITPSTDHSRENTPWLLYGKKIKAGCDLGTLPTFADISATILDYLEADASGLAGTSQLTKLLK